MDDASENTKKTTQNKSYKLRNTQTTSKKQGIQINHNKYKKIEKSENTANTQNAQQIQNNTEFES